MHSRREKQSELIFKKKIKKDFVLSYALHFIQINKGTI